VIQFSVNPWKQIRCHLFDRYVHPDVSYKNHTRYLLNSNEQPNIAWFQYFYTTMSEEHRIMMLEILGAVPHLCNSGW
jgi:hypothetical protein